MDFLLNYAHLIFVGFVALFPPVNPIGTALIMDPLLRGLDPVARRAASSRIALNCFILCAGSVMVGTYLFEFFGISLPIVQLAGGLLICKMGWTLLSSDSGVKEGQASEAPLRRPGDVEGILFYPLAFPMTTGAGTISVLLTLSAHVHAASGWTYATNLGALMAAIFLMCVVIYLSYAFTPALLHRLGQRGEQVVNRLSAFLVFCVGIQIAAQGITAIAKTVLHN